MDLNVMIPRSIYFDLSLGILFFLRKVTFIHSLAMTTVSARVGESLIGVLQLYIYVKL